MYSLVNVDPKKEYGVARLPEWKAIQDGLQSNLVHMLKHYRHASYSVGADHLLIRLLQSINVPLSLNSDRYYSNILANALITANSIGMTTPFGIGKLFHGVFFNKAIQEVIIGFDEPFKMDQIEKDWQNATPVRVLRHPFGKLGLQVPNGKFHSQETGVAVIAVNVCLLAAMHRAFVHEEQRKQQANPDYVMRNSMQFMHMFVLPNMLESYLDYALFNRMEEISRDVWPPREPARNVPIYLPSYEPLVARFYDRLNEILNASNYTAPMTLAAIPAASVPDMRSVMFTPDVVPTRQILWSVILARLPMLLFLVRAARKHNRVVNQVGLSEIQVTLRKLKAQRVLDSVLPKEIYQSTMDAIDEILGAL